MIFGKFEGCFTIRLPQSSHFGISVAPFIRVPRIAE